MFGRWFTEVEEDREGRVLLLEIGPDGQVQLVSWSLLG